MALKIWGRLVPLYVARNKAAVRIKPFFVMFFAAAGVAPFCTRGAAAPAVGETARMESPALSAIDAGESALNLKRTEALLATYLCPIADYLAEITRNPMTPIVWAKDREEYYVQCLFFDDDKQIRCEGASGYYFDKIHGFVTAAKRGTLAELGFSTDASVGNFARELRLEGRGTLPIAKLIIELLARVSDLGVSDKLEYYAPLLSPKKGNPVIVDPARCPVPVSSRPREFALSTILARHP